MGTGCGCGEVGQDGVAECRLEFWDEQGDMDCLEAIEMGEISTGFRLSRMKERTGGACVRVSGMRGVAGVLTKHDLRQYHETVFAEKY